MKGMFRIEQEIDAIPTPWGKFRFVSNPGSTGAKQITWLSAVVDPGKGHDFHMHPDQEEVVHVLSGTLEQWIEREKRILGPGDSAFIPAGVVHASFNAGRDGLRLIAGFSPMVGESGFAAVELADKAPWNKLRH